MNSQERKQYREERVLEKMLKYGTGTPETIETKMTVYMKRWGTTIWLSNYAVKYEQQLRRRSE